MPESSEGVNQGGCIVCEKRAENLKRMSQISDIGQTRKVQDGREMIK